MGKIMQTKYNIGDSLWCSYFGEMRGRSVDGPLKVISISVKNTGKILYVCGDGGSYEESLLSPSKAEATIKTHEKEVVFYSKIVKDLESSLESNRTYLAKAEEDLLKAKQLSPHRQEAVEATKKKLKESETP